MSSLIVVRHAVAECILGKLVVGPYGQLQMRELANSLRSFYKSVPSEEFAIVCSPVSRAHASAQVIADTLSCNITDLPCLDTVNWWPEEKYAEMTREAINEVTSAAAASVVVIVTLKEMAEATPRAINGSSEKCTVGEGTGWRIEEGVYYCFP